MGPGPHVANRGFSMMFHVKKKKKKKTINTNINKI